MASTTIRISDIFKNYHTIHQRTPTPIKPIDYIRLYHDLFWDFNWQLTDMNLKRVIETQIVMEYWNREIGYETIGMFKMKLEVRLESNVQKYNSMILSMPGAVNFLRDLDEIVKFTGDVRSLQDIVMGATSISTNKMNVDMTDRHNSQSNQSANTFNRGVVSTQPDTRLTLTANQMASTNTALQFADSVGEDRNIASSNSTGNTTQNMNRDSESTQDTQADTKTNTQGNQREDYERRTLGKANQDTIAQMVDEWHRIFVPVNICVLRDVRSLFYALYVND